MCQSASVSEGLLIGLLTCSLTCMLVCLLACWPVSISVSFFWRQMVVLLGFVACCTSSPSISPPFPPASTTFVFTSRWNHTDPRIQDCSRLFSPLSLLSSSCPFSSLRLISPPFSRQVLLPPYTSLSEKHVGSRRASQSLPSCKSPSLS